MRVYAGMNMRTFTPTEDALIREQPVTGISLKTLEKMLGTSRETLLKRAYELGVSLIKDDPDETIDARLRSGDKLIDPLLERLERIHGDRKYSL